MSTDVEQGVSEEELAAANSKNNLLAARVHFLFCDSWECVDGYQGGGEFKIDKILRHDVPVDGPKSKDLHGPATPLARLLRRLYRLLNTHYNALDYEHLRQYAAERLNPPQRRHNSLVEKTYKQDKFQIEDSSDDASGAERDDRTVGRMW